MSTTGPIEAVVFDFGGVYTQSPFAALRQVGEDLGHDPDDAMAVLFGPYDEDTDHPWHRAERGEIDLDATRRAIRDLGAERGMEIDLYDLLGSMASGAGVREVVVERTRSLRNAGYRTALVTNNLAEFAGFWRPMMPLDELFDVVIDSSEVGMRKPNPRIYLLALEMLGDVAPERAVFLDDYPGNVEAARRLGFHGIVVGDDPVPALLELDLLLARGG